jgi:hypothetical protein
MEFLSASAKMLGVVKPELTAPTRIAADKPACQSEGESPIIQQSGG